MVNFKVSAPGTLNLLGENVTCEDHNGIMTSMNQRNIITFNELRHSENIIKLNFSKINLNYEICLDRFRNFYSSCIFDETMSEQILQLISFGRAWNDHDHKIIVHTLFYLLAYVTYKENKENINIEDITPFEVYLEAQSPIVSAFGVFSSFAVCFAACFLHWSHLKRNDYHQLNDNDRDKISMYSKSCDNIITHCMFKSEVTVSTHGYMLRYCCNSDSSQTDVLKNMPNTTVMIIDTNTNDPTPPMLTTMKQNMLNMEPDIAKTLLDSIRTISDMAFSILKEINDMNRNDPTYKQDVLAQEKILFPLIRMQQEFNEIFINFNMKMLTVCKIAEELGFVGKCADFNYGKHAYVLCPSGKDIYDMDIILKRNSFVTRDFDLIEDTNLNCDGVKIE